MIHSQLSSVHALVNILLSYFHKTRKLDQTVNIESQYSKFVQVFAQQHNMNIYGTALCNGIWNTSSFEFHTQEDELFFILKYGAL